VTAASEDSSTTTDASTEVGSEDLSSSEEESSDEETTSSEDEFSSKSATECEFTDSEGKPNPFHKDLDDSSGRIIGPESPGAARRIYAQHKIPPPGSGEAATTIPAPPPPTQSSGLTYAAKYQYKTPNLSDRLRSEAKTSVVQDFSTRKALNLKKNWVSEAADPGSAAAKRGGSNKQKEEIDSRLKSLMDRLSSQQKLLKPAEKPSTEMQHFLKQSNANKSSSEQPLLASHPQSPPAATVASSLHASPPVYKPLEIPTALSPAANVKGEECVSKVPSSAREPKIVIDEPPPERGRSSPNGDSIKAPLALNESGSSAKDDDFQSCNEEGEQEGEVVVIHEAVNPSALSPPEVQQGTSTESSFRTPGSLEEDDDKDFTPKGEMTTSTPKAPTSLPPLTDGEEEEEKDQVVHATENGLDDIELIDEADENGKEEEEDEVNGIEDEEEKKPPVFTEDDVTKIYSERNPKERVQLMKNYKEKEKSVVHDLILGRRSQTRSSSAVRRATRLMPSNRPPPPPENEEAASTPPTHRRSAKEALKPASHDQQRTALAQPKQLISTAIVKNVPPSPPAKEPYDEEDVVQLRTKVNGGIGVKLVAPPVRRQVSQPPQASADRVQAGGNRPLTISGSSPLVTSSPEARDDDPHGELMASPDVSVRSNDMDSYMDGILSTDADSPSKSASSAASASKVAGKDRRNFMKAISGIFSRSSSVSSVNRSARSPTTESSPCPAGQQQLSQSLNAGGRSRQPNNNSNSSRELKAQQQQQQQHNFRFPRLNFARSASAQRSESSKHRAAQKEANVVGGLAPKADISELGSLPSLSGTPKKDFRPAIQPSHPSTPPVPLSRRIELGLAATATASENEENESPEENSVDSTCSDLRRQEEEERQRLRKQSQGLPPEILEKLIRRGGKAAKRQARAAQVKRVRRAQELQRQLEELDEQHRDLEERGVAVERALRGEEEEEGGDAAETMRSWFRLLAEKNRLVRRDQELQVQAKNLELEDRSARLEAELRDHLMLDSRSAESVAKEGEVLGELLAISEQREKLQAMLEGDRARYRREDRDIEAHMAARGILDDGSRMA